MKNIAPMIYCINAAAFAFIVILLSTSLKAQDTSDVLFLKNGLVLKGIVVENIPDHCLSLALPNGRIDTLDYSELTPFSATMFSDTERDSDESEKYSAILETFTMDESSPHVQRTSPPPLEVVPVVDLQRYLGTWFEIGRLPNRFQKQCMGEVTATYSLRKDGDITVVNRCRLASGEYEEAEGKAKRASDDGPNTKLKVRFAPAFLSIFPFVWGDYWIIVLAPDYSYAVVGEPSRNYLWVLSRTPVMDEAILQGVFEEIKNKGYDLTNFIRTKQVK